MAAVVLGACGAEKKPATTPVAQTTTNSAPILKQASPSVAVDEDIARACNLQVSNLESAPKFGFDKSELAEADRNVLGKIAECFTTGPLKGRSLQLIGRADTRGEAQYNLALGANRASNVGDYLARLGLAKDRLDLTSRGELDAVGIDEAGWQTDRRVDLLLVKKL
jgi:peptidoglycan-associated lipoprotein